MCRGNLLRHPPLRRDQQPRLLAMSSIFGENDNIEVVVHQTTVLSNSTGRCTYKNKEIGL